MRRVAVLLNLAEHDPRAQRDVAVFRGALARTGWREGDNLTLDLGSNADMANAAAAELVRAKPDVILASATDGLAAVRQETGTIPIVFVVVSDPVGQGFVASLAQPGGNITDFSAFEFSMGAKWISTIKELVPSIARIAVVFNPKTAPYFQQFLRSIEAGASVFEVNVIATPVEDTASTKDVINAVSRDPYGGLVFPSDRFTSVHRSAIVAWTAAHRVPAIYASREFVADGALVAYGIDRIDQYRQAAAYVDRIPRGAKPGDLPVQPPTKFELAINLKTARSLGLAVPSALLARADEVIE
jgi:putative ABC transport system substrate-binding protein